MGVAKNIVLFSDGTGNSSAKLNKTNVWRLYRALDLSGRSRTRQLAYYDDGVGTSAFKPLALLGGAFGWGLKRNVIDLYKFLCRNYKDEDFIYLFGFSRGAFTVRVLGGLIASQGIKNAASEQDLHRQAAQAFRAYRKERYTKGIKALFRRKRARRVQQQRETDSFYGSVGYCGRLRVAYR